MGFASAFALLATADKPLYPSYVPETNVDKIDFKKELATLYSAPKNSFAAVDVPVMKFVKIGGKGDPNRDPAYKRAIEWLYSLSYAMKFASKAKSGKDYVVPPLEGLWWTDNPDDFAGRRKHLWQWTMMIMVPDFVERSLYEAALARSGTSSGSLRPRCVLSHWTKGDACRRCISAAMTTKARRSPGFTTRSCLRRG